MKNKVNFKVLEQSLRLASKASDLERECDNMEISQLLHEVNLMALGIPKVVTEGETESALIEIRAAIEQIRVKIAKLPIQSEAIFEFARLLDEESELVKRYQPNTREIAKPVKASRLSIQDRGRYRRPLNLKAGFQTSLF
ncbi:hypothetical protein [Roseivirga spongicola]|uniref:Uncharacterized protein n=1 Tax=Roseivirga spongicola TaxID=333140 RepID=A0A150X4W4_9BACT|nr:hypothetical protein [Roseivirga spongicola]KYG73682.1 hypothetical protein AWW68_13420 [Roseivirga spongicola]WPZ09682.1 hypothetical protein T7867_15570 [Roseivirga spongicola]